MKRFLFIVLAALLLLGIGYAVLHRQGLGFSAPRAENAPGPTEPAPASVRPPTIVWHNVDRASDGFRIEMPAAVQQIQVPAYNEAGAAEQVNMIISSPGAETTFSIAWADNPPVARVNNLIPDQTLEMAESGAMARTHTGPDAESPIDAQGYPGRDLAAGNSAGGVMNSRFILAGTRLYMLVAAFPSAAARRDRDVTHFFNSFTILTPAAPLSGNGCAWKACETTR